MSQFSGGANAWSDQVQYFTCQQSITRGTQGQQRVQWPHEAPSRSTVGRFLAGVVFLNHPGPALGTWAASGEHRSVPSNVRIGTSARVEWPDSACSILDETQSRFLQIAQDYAWLNSHPRMAVAHTAIRDARKEYPLSGTSPN